MNTRSRDGGVARSNPRSTKKWVTHASQVLGVLSFFSLVGCDSVAPLGDFGHRALNVFTRRTPVDAAQQMQSDNPDQRYVGITRLADEPFGRRAPYTTRYQQIAQSDSDWLVRAYAIRALNRSRDASATPIYIRGLNDENDIVRVESAKALVHTPDQNAVSTLLARLNDANESRDVRIWSAEALKHYHTLEVARSLVNQLNSREFGVASESHQSLMDITGRDLRYDETAWLDFLTGNERPLG